LEKDKKKGMLAKRRKELEDEVGVVRDHVSRLQITATLWTDYDAKISRQKISRDKQTCAINALLAQLSRLKMLFIVVGEYEFQLSIKPLHDTLATFFFELNNFIVSFHSSLVGIPFLIYGNYVTINCVGYRELWIMLLRSNKVVVWMSWAMYYKFCKVRVRSVFVELHHLTH